MRLVAALCGSVATAISVFAIYAEGFFPSDSLQRFKSSSVIWPNPSLSFLPPLPLSSPLCMPYVFPCARGTLAGFQSYTPDKCLGRLSLVVRQLVAAK